MQFKNQKLTTTIRQPSQGKDQKNKGRTQGGRQPTISPESQQQNRIDLQKQLQQEDVLVRKKIVELSNFLLSAKSVFQDPSLSKLDQLIAEGENPKEVDLSIDLQMKENERLLQQQKKNAQLNYKIIEQTAVNEKMVTYVPVNQPKFSDPTSNRQQQLNPQTNEELSKLLETMHSLLERNLQESHNLQKQLENSSAVYGYKDIEQQKGKVFKGGHTEERPTSFLLDEKMDQFNDDLQDGEKKLNQIQIQRLLVKISALNQKIQDLQSQISDSNQAEQNLRNIMLQCFCISQTDFLETTVENWLSSINQNVNLIETSPFQRILIKIKNDTIHLSNHDIDDKLAFKSIKAMQIKDVFYPSEQKPIIAIVYEDFKVNSDSSPYQPTTLYSNTQTLVEYRKQSELFFKKQSVLIFQFSTWDDLDKWDLALWALCKRAIAVNKRYKKQDFNFYRFVFENDFFERPFYDQFSLYQYSVSDFEKLRLVVKGIIEQANPTVKFEEIQKKASELDLNRSKLSKNIQENFQQISVTPPMRQSQLKSSKLQSQVQSSAVQSRGHSAENLKQSKLPARSMIIQNSNNELDKIQKAVALLKSGFYMIKYSSNQLNPNHRVVYLSENEFILKWKEPLKPFEKPLGKKQTEKKGSSNDPRSIEITSIKSVKDFAEGSGFTKFRKQRQGKENLAITIIAQTRNLELDASSQEDKMLFIECLELAIKNPKIREISPIQ